MEPHVRPYNSNGPGESRKRPARGGKRSEATARKVAQPAKVETRAIEVELSPAALGLDGSVAADVVTDVTPVTPVAQVAPALPVADVAPVATGVAADAHARPPKPEPEPEAAPPESGPMVSVDDFEEIFARFQTPLTNFVFRLVGNREQAYDLAQDVFVKAYRALASGTTIQAAALSSWLYRIASNTATDALRRRRLISWLPLSLFNEDRGVGAGMPGLDNTNGQSGYSAEEHLSNATNAFSSGYDGGRFEQRVADREIVQAVLQKLPEKYASCLLLYEHEGFSCAEIADILNVSPSAVKMRLMRARERFISLYQQEVNGR